MAEYQDYSGRFNPALQLEDFSKEAMGKLLKEYQRAYLLILGEWHRTMRERYGEVQAIEADCSQWMLSEGLVARFLCKAMSIKPENTESFFKHLQIDPGFPMKLFDIEWELVNPNLGYITVKNCTALQVNEREGKGYEIPMCHIEEPPTMINAAYFHNPNLIFRPTKLPPRKSLAEVACIWEVKVVKPEENPFPFWSAEKRKRVGLPHDPKEFPKPWSEEQIKVMWELFTENVRKVMRAIARKPNGCLMDDLIKQLGMSREDVSFYLGFQYMAIFETPWPQKLAPVRFRNNPWRYEMDKEWAQAIAKLEL